LPKQVEAQLNFEVEKKTKGKAMPYITSWERRGMERGEKVGEQKGKEKGQKEMLLQLLKWKFGEVERGVAAKIEQLPATRLNRLAKALLKFTEPADLTRWLDRNAV
jgi:predicted transposase YdaD